MTTRVWVGGYDERRMTPPQRLAGMFNAEGNLIGSVIGVWTGSAHDGGAMLFNDTKEGMVLTVEQYDNRGTAVRSYAYIVDFDGTALPIPPNEAYRIWERVNA